METPTEKNEYTLLRDIQNGKYCNQYLIYNRKSTDEPDSQKNSIKYQKAENMRFAFREHLSIADISLKNFCRSGIISEKHSGFKEDSQLEFGKDGTVQYRIERPKFYQLVQLLSKGYFKGVIILSWDRASRNKGDNTIIEKLIKQGIDFRFTLASYEKTSSGALHMDIDGMFAAHHSRVTSEKVSLATANQRSRGICTYRAPVGYLNTGTMDTKPLDPVRAPMIKQMFELYATGEWSLAGIARFANEHGFTMPPFRRRRTKDEILAEEEDEDTLSIEAVCRPVTYNNVHKILINPFYTGRIIGPNGNHILSISHQALVSDELFDTVQVMLNKKNVSKHYDNKLPSPYRGLVRCALCHRAYTPYVQKGIVYYGSRCKSNCVNKRKTFNLPFLETEIGNLIRKLSFTEEELIELDARTRTDIALFEIKRNAVRDQSDRKKKKVLADLSYLRTNRLSLLRTGVYTPENYLYEEDKLNSELSTLQDEEQISDVSMHEVIKDIVYLSELLNDLYYYYKIGKSEEKERVIRKLFSELLFSEKGLEYKCIGGLEALESRFIAVGDPTGWLSELLRQHTYIVASISAIKELLD